MDNVAILIKKIDNDIILKNLNYFFDKSFCNNISERYHFAADMRRDIDTLEESKFDKLGGGGMMEIATVQGTRGLEKSKFRSM